MRDIILYVLHRKTQTEMLPLTMETIFYNKSLNQEIADAEHGHPFFLNIRIFGTAILKIIDRTCIIVYNYTWIKG